MTDVYVPRVSLLLPVANALVALHKSQFGRGPTRAHAYWAGPDALVCLLEDVLLPAERKLTELGDAGRVRDARTAYQAATADDFVAAVEQIVCRKVTAFASAIDPYSNTVFENFVFEPQPDGNGAGPLAS